MPCLYYNSYHTAPCLLVCELGCESLSGSSLVFLEHSTALNAKQALKIYQINEWMDVQMLGNMGSHFYPWWEVGVTVCQKDRLLHNYLQHHTMNNTLEHKQKN